MNPDSRSSFNSSDGWLDNFKQRFVVRLLIISGEKLSSQQEFVAFKIKLQQKITKLVLLPQQIYNADKTGSFYKMLPKRTYGNLKKEMRQEGKEPKNVLHF